MKKLLSLILVIVLGAGIAVSGTMAYLQDTDSDVNVMTLGNVSIAQHEYERVVDENGDYETTTVTKADGSTQESYKLQPFTQAKPLYPVVGNPKGGYTSTYARFEQLSEGASGGQQFLAGIKNGQDKIVLVENTGKSDAYVRTIIAFEAGSKTYVDWDKLIKPSTGNDEEPWDYNWSIGVVEIDGNNYVIMEAVYTGYSYGNMRHNGGVLPAGEWTYNNLAEVYMVSTATNEDVEAIDGNKNGTYDILVLSQAVQTSGFDNAQTALDTAFGKADATNVKAWFEKKEFKAPTVVEDAAELTAALTAGGSAVLTEDIADAPVNTTAPYGNYYGVALNGGTLDGNGNTLDFDLGELKGGKADNYGVMTSGGTIKNATITGVFRGIYIMNPTEDIYIDNVTIGDEDVCYAINTGEGDGTHSLYVSNSTIKGWSSYGTAIKDLYFTNCTFAQGEYYTDVYGRLVKPYVNAVFENCEFNSKFYIDLSAFEGEQVVLKNCTVNGVKLTADNWKSLIVSESDCGEGQISIEAKDGSYMSATNVLDYVVIK